MSAHTPGPWATDGHIYGGSRFFVGSEFRGGAVCSVVCRDDEGEANARLIAAAPELLEAVMHLAEALEDGHWQNTKEHLRELIAKATGAA